MHWGHSGSVLGGFIVLFRELSGCACGAGGVRAITERCARAARGMFLPGPRPLPQAFGPPQGLFTSQPVSRYDNDKSQDMDVRTQITWHYRKL